MTDLHPIDLQEWEVIYGSRKMEGTMGVKPQQTQDGKHVVCPWCGYRHTDLYDKIDFEHAADVRSNCDRCDKPITSWFSCVYTYHCNARLEK